MKELIHSKKQLTVSIIFGLMILAGITLCIPFVDNIAIHYIELFFHKTLRDPARWIDVLQHSSKLCIFILCLIYFFAYIKKGIEIRGLINQRILEIKDKHYAKQTLHIFAGLCVFLFIVYFNIITANYFYADDVFRNYGGNRSWIGFSRYISEFFSIFIHNNLKLNDIAPFTQFISIVISAFTILLLSIALTDEINVKNCLALSIIFIAPFYAENISYRFDCLYMTMALFFSAIPFLFIENKKSFISISIISLLLTCCSYQAALPIYILCTIYLFAKKTIRNEDTKQNWNFALQAVISFVIALVLFKLLFMNKMSNTSDDYFSTKISISAIIPNTINYLKTTFTLNGGILSKLLFIVSIFLLFINLLKKSNKILNTILVIILIPFSYILSFGPYLVFERTLFAPRALIGFNVFIALLLLANLKLSEKLFNKFAVITTVLSVYTCIIFMFTYGNCLKNQKDYEDFRVSLILNDLSEVSSANNNYNISIKNDIGLTEKNRIAVRNYPLIKKLISSRPSDGHIWNEEILNGYNFNCTAENRELTDDFILIKQTYYHDIYQNGNNFIVVLN